MKETTVISSSEIARLSGWFSESKESLPEDVQRIFTRALRILAALDGLIFRHKKLLKSFREAMGISPKSERGAALDQQTNQ